MIRSNLEPPGGAAKAAPYDPQRFDWPLAYPSEKFIAERLQEFLAKNSFPRTLAQRMRDETGTDFFEWVDHLVLSTAAKAALREIGFVPDEVEAAPGEQVWHHPRATLPRVILRGRQRPSPSVVALRPEFVTDFIARHNLPADIKGEPFSQYRRALVH